MLRKNDVCPSGTIQDELSIRMDQLTNKFLCGRNGCNSQGWTFVFKVKCSVQTCSEGKG